MVILDTILGKKVQPTVPSTPTNSPITPEEDAKIKNWVNKTYSGQSEAYKTAAYKDAYNAVIERKASNQKKAQNETRRQVVAGTASYKGSDKVKKEEAKLAKAEMAIIDAADIIRQGQRANGVKVNDNLTDKQVVDSFLLANNGKPYAEYLGKYLNGNISGNSEYNNLWLASKLGLDTGKTMGIDNSAIINAQDKTNAAIKGFGQGLVNLTQNTLGRAANYVGSNLGAGLGEVGYAVADMMGADTSEGSVWDKLKKAEGYSWEEAGKKASSREGLNRGVLSEDQKAFDLGETGGELAADIALTAPAEGVVGGAITASKLGKGAKFGLQALNAAGAGAGFQLAEDLTDKEKVDNLELSSPTDYAKSGVIAAGTAGIGNALGKSAKILKKAPRVVFGASDRAENAILTKSLQEWDNMSDISKGFAKDVNAASTPYTELAKPLKQAKETLETDRLNVGQKLEDVRNNLQYVGKSTKDGSMYTTKEVVNDLNESLKTLSDPKKYGKKVADASKIPQFELKDGKLSLSEESLEQLNAFNGVNSKGKEVNLGDEIIKLYNRVYGKGEKVNAATTESFIRQLKSLYKQGWSGGDNNLLKVTLDSLDNIETKFNNSLTSKSLSDLQRYNKLDEAAITLDKNFEKLIGAMDKGSVEDVKASLKAMKGNASIEELFKQVKKSTGVDMNNEVLSWAYNLSLYDVKKANELLNTFYPSKAGLIETVIKTLSNPIREKVAREQVKSGIRTSDMPTDTDRLNVVFTEIANIINSDKTDL